MALPTGITPKLVTIGIGSFFDGTLVSGTVLITAPANVVHTPTGRPIYSSVMQQKFVDGSAEFLLCPTDAPGLNRVDWTYKLSVQIDGAITQPEVIYFTLPSAGPDTIDLDTLVTVPSGSGTPISVTTVTSVNGQVGDVTVASDADIAALVPGPSATSDALRAVFGRRALAYGDPSQEPDGTVTALTSGQAVTNFGSNPLTVTSGLYTHTPGVGTNTTAYVQVDLGGKVGRIGADVKIPVGATGSIAFVLPLTVWANNQLPEAGIHFVMYRDNWHVSHWNGNGEDIYTQGTFAAIDDGGVHRVEINLKGDTAYITLPDQSVVKVVDSRINTAVSTLAIWELYEQNGNTDVPLIYAGLWADTVPALGMADPTPYDEAVSRSLIPGAASYTVLAPGTDATTAVGTGEGELMRTTIVVPTNLKKWVRLAAYLEVFAALQVYFEVRADVAGGSGGLFMWQQKVIEASSAMGTYSAERLVDFTGSGFAPGDEVDLRFMVWGTAASAANIVAGSAKAATVYVSSTT